MKNASKENFEGRDDIAFAGLSEPMTRKNLRKLYP